MKLKQSSSNASIAKIMGLIPSRITLLELIKKLHLGFNAVYISSDKGVYQIHKCKCTKG